MQNKILIDPDSGFCYGVVRAIEAAEKALQSPGALYSLGAIVHNNMEASRLKDKGLRFVNLEDFPSIAGERVLIRAHGEPPGTYSMAQKYGIKLLECTCPVVLRLQQNIKENYTKIKSREGQLVLLGRKGHAEVNGLIGQVNGDVLIIEDITQIDTIDYSRPVALFSQTTQDPALFDDIASAISTGYKNRGMDPKQFLEIHKTICHQVSQRRPALEAFAKSVDILFFICGRDSSNGKVLFRVCKDTNERSFMIQSPEEIDFSLIRPSDTIGLCGATSTPRWLLEKAASILENS